MEGRGSTGRRALAWVLGLSLGACGPSPRPTDVSPVDAGRDANRVRDGAPIDAPPDTGPPPDPVLPAQSWEATFRFDDMTGLGVHDVTASITVDARAESGSVRTVIGANGRSANVTFDIPRPGELVAHDRIDLGVSVPQSECRVSIARIANARLTFRDADGDGIFEELVTLEGDQFAVDQFGNMYGGAPFVTTDIRRDTTGPTLTLIPTQPIGAGDVVQLVASEPIEPSAIPYVEAAGRRFALHEAAGSSAPSQWSLALSTLPVATGYTLRFDGEVRDVAGNLASSTPETTFDVTDLGTLRPSDGFETGLEGVQAEGGVRAISGAELPLVGASSAFVIGRAVIAIVPPRSASFMTFQLRVHADTSETFSPWIRVRAGDGRVVGIGAMSLFTYQPGTVAGLAVQSDASFGSVSFPAGEDLLIVEIDPHGSSDISCSGVAPTPPDVVLGMTLDAFEVR